MYEICVIVGSARDGGIHSENAQYNVEVTKWKLVSEYISIGLRLQRSEVKPV